MRERREAVRADRRAEEAGRKKESLATAWNYLMMRDGDKVALDDTDSHDAAPQRDLGPQKNRYSTTGFMRHTWQSVGHSEFRNRGTGGVDIMSSHHQRRKGSLGSSGRSGAVRCFRGGEGVYPQQRLSLDRPWL